MRRAFYACRRCKVFVEIARRSTGTDPNRRSPGNSGPDAFAEGQRGRGLALGSHGSMSTRTSPA